ncbi:hypothetical protein DDZ13_05500 [Coraliomargarita sinensis]|uniref:Cyclic GMP-AMP synthase n=1 Tax=Coraliomargarita sinensis TaxID=2174842 RepID=A0A317ZL07_9BACT|nr:hypothetical protein DDZ13_05500 [Coraliomargarita sinensis]
MVIPNADGLEQALLAVAEYLDLPPGMADSVQKRYKSISDWIERESSELYGFAPKIYTQGSFAIGTVVRPLSEADEFDIDMVCELQRKRDELTQKQLYDDVGGEVEGYVDAQNFKKDATPWEKCWTIEYSDDGYTFKVDIVPCLPDSPSRVRLVKEAKLSANLAETAIILTDKDHAGYEQIVHDWERGNPKGYAEWFKGRMRVRLNEAKEARAKMVKLAAEDIPTYSVRTPLQRAIQIIKRHRDTYFEKRGHRTSSIILTTLAAWAYQNEGNIVDAMEAIVGGIDRSVVWNGYKYRITNPIDPDENFAKQWNEDRRYADAFSDWLQALRADWEKFKSEHNKDLPVLFESRFGKSASARAFPEFALREGGELVISSPQLPSRFNVPHRQRAEQKWDLIKLRDSIVVSAQYSQNGRWIHFDSDSNPLPKGCSLQFHAETNIQKPFQVFWQVVNTGFEAQHFGQLRGEICAAKSYGAGGLFNRESTSYTGTHWVQCFIEKNGICVAQSEPYVVNIEG